MSRESPVSHGDCHAETKCPPGDDDNVYINLVLRTSKARMGQ